MRVLSGPCHTSRHLPVVQLQGEHVTLLAIAFPIPPGKIDAWKAWVAELTGACREEFVASRREVGVQERTFLQRTPAADLTIVTLEGDDPMAAFMHHARSTDPFSVWFRAKVLGDPRSRPVRSDGGAAARAPHRLRPGLGLAERRRRQTGQPGPVRAGQGPRLQGHGYKARGYIPITGNRGQRPGRWCGTERPTLEQDRYSRETSQ